ncbi:hypothetical protein [Bradyrhizobium sp.]|uniref:hypothetical protein n=1 Tax=Bradyrhizobium sp. TaxID=376 RepID=UPI00272EF766|nr:hypothetical protein [Bradyrhizobium sp.]MDP1865460.1 hypothetical protein [Bradyrhizobium sp.]MDP3079106.1 hypothetical protein [Bradyrhizobium sp.]
MFALRSGTFQFGLMLATALAVSTLPAAGQGYSQEQQQACTPDAMRLCSAYIPDVDRITVCMIQNKSQLSPPCRGHFRPAPSAFAPVHAGRPLGITPAKARKPVAAKAKKKPAKPETS